jgi:Protein of unknown function (DUF2793)
MDASSNLNLPFIAAAQAQKHVTHNEALRALDAVVQLMVLDKDLATPPGSPSEGARYVVAASPTGAWAGQADKIAAYQDGAWAFYVPLEGWLAWIADEDELYVWNGSAWTTFPGGGGAGGLADVVEDATPQLGGDLDANGFSIQFDDAKGIEDDAGNEHIVFHKTAAAVNQVGITNAATGTAPQIAAEGGDADIDLTLAGKGSGHPKAAVFGVNGTADATTRFAVSAAATLFNHAGAGHQHKINKNAAGDTASLLFQTGFSGRAEMGTTGDDDFHFKVSADGSAWNEAIVVDGSTGRVSLPATPNVATLTFVVDGGGAAIATGIKGDLEVPFACTINQVSLLADQTGSIVVDIWKDTYANYPPTVGDSITASAKPTIASATKAQDATLTGWTTAITAGDILRFNVDSATSIQRCTISLKVTKS